MARPIWLIRGGEENRHVDAFLDGGYTAMGVYEVGDGRRTPKHVVLQLIERGGRHKDPAVAANRFLQFVNAVAIGDAVLMPDGARKEIVVGVVEGDYEFDESVPVDGYRHRRAVRWVARHDRDELPAAWHDLHKERAAIRRLEAEALTEHVDAVLDGTLGRRATDRRGRVTGTGTTRAPRTPRAAAAPKAKAPALRTCPGCGFNLAPTVFEGHDLCRDCRA